MPSPSFRASRRQALMQEVSEPILLPGNGHRPRNLPMSPLPFRQDSTFLYFIGEAPPGSFALLHEGRCRVYVTPPAEDDAIWHGEVESLDALRSRLGVDAVLPLEDLSRDCSALPTGSLQSLAVPDDRATSRASELSGLPLRFGQCEGSDALIESIIRLRRCKHEVEIQAHREAVAITADAFALALASTRAGGHERSIAALFEAKLYSAGACPGYSPIVTVRGEILHNFHPMHPLEAGQLLLLDGGAELSSGYGADVTRTWPVGGQFSPRQRAAYEAVLAAQQASIALCRPGTRYRDVHLRSAEVLAEWLREERLLTCGVQEAVEAGAHALFFPHGVGHLLGLDVHDLEQFGDRAAYAPGRERDSQFGLSYLRLDMDLEPGMIVTVEPGFYMNPAILSDSKLRARLGPLIDWERAEQWLGFGGIRIEDDILVTENEPDVLSRAIPSTVQDLEERIGQGLAAADRLRA